MSIMVKQKLKKANKTNGSSPNVVNTKAVNTPSVRSKNPHQSLNGYDKEVHFSTHIREGGSDSSTPSSSGGTSVKYNLFETPNDNGTTKYILVRTDKLGFQGTGNLKGLALFAPLYYSTSIEGRTLNYSHIENYNQFILDNANVDDDGDVCVPFSDEFNDGYNMGRGYGVESVEWKENNTKFHLTLGGRPEPDDYELVKADFEIKLY